MNKRSLTFILFALVAQISAETSLSAKTSDGFIASAKSVLQSRLVDPLKKKEAERSRFSRAVLPPHARRIRILENNPQTDGRGKLFVLFAIDEGRGFGGDQEKEDRWLKEVITGCVYPETGDVMVKRGEVYYPSAMLLGLQAPKAPAGVCRAS